LVSFSFVHGLLFLPSSAPPRPPVAKVAPKLANVSARKLGMGGRDEERAELMNEVSTTALKIHKTCSVQSLLKSEIMCYSKK